MTGAVWSPGEFRTCRCGATWQAHCKHRACRWVKCSRRGCTGLYDLRTRRMWILKRDIPKVA